LSRGFLRVLKTAGAAAVFGVALALMAAPVVAQDATRLAEDPAVKAALEAVRRNEPRFIEEQVRICEIPAPPFHEDARGKELERLFKQAGLENVRIDKVGNVIGARPGASPRPNFVLAAHLDTVFPEGTDVKVTRDGLLSKAPALATTAAGSPFCSR